jgi:hypothetical protein
MKASDKLLAPLTLVVCAIGCGTPPAFPASTASTPPSAPSSLLADAHGTQSETPKSESFATVAATAAATATTCADAFAAPSHEAIVTPAEWSALAQKTIDVLAAGAKKIVATKHLDGPPTGTIPSLDELTQTMSSEIVGNACIPFKFISGDCFARAHVVANKLAAHGFNSAKIFAYRADKSRLLSASNEYFRSVTWKFHVAALVVVSVGSTHDLRVVDGSVDPAPLAPAEWLARIDAKGGPVTLEFDTRDEYFPRTQKNGSTQSGTPPAFETNLVAAWKQLAKDRDTLSRMKPVPERAGSPIATHVFERAVVSEMDAKTVSFVHSPAVFSLSDKEKARLEQNTTAPKSVTVDMNEMSVIDVAPASP